MKKKLSLLVAFTLILGLLTACDSKSSVVGTWADDDDDAVFLAFETDGTARMYDEDYDQLYYVTWTEKDGVVTLDSGDDTIELKVDGDKLIVEGEEGSMTRADADVPFVVYSTLYYVTWMDADEKELVFWSDESWEIYDADGEAILEGLSESVTIDGATVTLVDVDGVEHIGKISDAAEKLTFADDKLTFEAE